MKTPALLLVLGLCLAALGTRDAHAQLFGQNQGNTPPVPHGSHGSGPPVIYVPSTPSPRPQPTRMQTSAQIHASEIFGATRQQWQTEQANVASRGRELAAEYDRLAHAARAARSSGEYRHYADRAQRIRGELGALERRYRQAAFVLSVWHRPTTIVYYEGRDDARFPVIGNPKAYLRANPHLIGTEIVARHPGF